MGFSIANYNKNLFEVDTTNFEYKKLSEIYTGKPEIFILNGFYINDKGKYGEQFIAIVSEFKILVNIPKHLNVTFSAMQSDLEAIEAIKAQKVGFYIRPYSAQGKLCYTITFVDL